MYQRAVFCVRGVLAWLRICSTISRGCPLKPAPAAPSYFCFLDKSIANTLRVVALKEAPLHNLARLTHPTRDAVPFAGYFIERLLRLFLADIGRLYIDPQYIEIFALAAQIQVRNTVAHRLLVHGEEGRRIVLDDLWILVVHHAERIEIAVNVAHRLSRHCWTASVEGKQIGDFRLL